jgi:hypothetical protein
MPATRDKTNSENPSDKGFAALETKVEEIQVDAAIETELGAADAAAARSESAMNAAAERSRTTSGSLERDDAAASGGDRPALDPAAPMNALLSAFGACAERGLRLHAETLVSFAQARSPQDLLAAQLAYAERTYAFYSDAMAHFAPVMPLGLRPEANR